MALWREGTGDLERSRKFYSRALLPLGVGLIAEHDGCIGFGANGKASLWVAAGDNRQQPMHIAPLQNRSAVDEFHAAAGLAGGQDNSAPGIRANYSATYYAAFVTDPDGHDVEAVCRRLSKSTRPAPASSN